MRYGISTYFPQPEQEQLEPQLPWNKSAWVAGHGGQEVKKLGGEKGEVEEGLGEKGRGRAK